MSLLATMFSLLNPSVHKREEKRREEGASGHSDLFPDCAGLVSRNDRHSEKYAHATRTQMQRTHLFLFSLPFRRIALWQS
jgi:hypothetical protein